jgi:hydrogenase maturation protease
MNKSASAPKVICGPPRILVLGYGNSGRQDDGLGPAAAAAIDLMGLPNLQMQDNYQLNIEDAIDVAKHDIVWFVDASKTGTLSYTVQDLSAVSTLDFTSHFVRPEFILAIAQQYFGRLPETCRTKPRARKPVKKRLTIHTSLLPALIGGFLGNIAFCSSSRAFARARPPLRPPA